MAHSYSPFGTLGQSDYCSWNRILSLWKVHSSSFKRVRESMVIFFQQIKLTWRDISHFEGSGDDSCTASSCLLLQCLHCPQRKGNTMPASSHSSFVTDLSTGEICMNVIIHCGAFGSFHLTAFSGRVPACISALFLFIFKCYILWWEECVVAGASTCGSLLSSMWVSGMNSNL